MPNRESWEENIFALNRVDHELADAFQAFHEALEETDRSHLFVTKARYPFLTHLISKGEPKWPSGEKIDDRFIIARGLPFGVILTNTCEVLDTVVGGQGATMPQAVLRPGSPLGLFELLDHLTGEVGSPLPDWTIVAGAHSFDTVCPVSRAEFVKKLRRGHSEEEQHLFDPTKYEACKRLVDRLSLIPRITRELQKWTVEVLFFSKSWFDALGRSIDMLPQSPPNNLRSATTALIELLFTRGWRAVTPIRNTSSTQYSAFVPQSRRLDAPTSAFMQDAYRLFSRTFDFLRTRRPVFSVDKVDSEYGPYGVLCESFLKAGGARDDLFFLRPATLGQESPIGYMPLNILLPTTFGGGAVQMSILEGLIRQIYNAYKRTLDTDVGKLPIRYAPQVFECLTFRVPRLGVKTETAGKSANDTFEVRFEKDNFRIVHVSDEKFFSPDIGSLSAKNASFFRGCVRLQYRPPESWT